MASRQEIYQRKLSLKRQLRERCRSGALRVGEPAPSLRDLADEFGISASLVSQTMQELIEDQLFHTVPRSGTFVGPPQHLSRETYLLFTSRISSQFDRRKQLKTGFENRIAELGGAVLALDKAQAQECLQNGTLPQAVGVFEWDMHLPNDFATGSDRSSHGALVARARFGTADEIVPETGIDLVSFDDRAGGYLATRHLLMSGHRRIAFLGLHHPMHATLRIWSGQREEGWRKAMDEAGLESEMLSWHPANPSPTDKGEEGEVERAWCLEAAHRLLEAPAVSGVVTANDNAAAALLDALEENDVPPKEWPSIVSFDNSAELQEHLLTSLRLPWDELGRAAADLLWKRRHGQLPAEAQHRAVQMRLIPRLTCQTEWSSLAQRAGLSSTISSLT
ncbi:MAG TPA: substrate-binding domain-containing protein [Abditibacteriaceae bacterium]|jgi:DNA-binding transcriptional regulator YhcF (GntR family)|nr:substrate-binding domain-containing protein [Abditibacteriaceae bacterium]